MMSQPAVSEAELGPLMTLEEWAELPDEVPGEFVNGRLVEEEVPDYLHEVLIAWLVWTLGSWGYERGVIVGGSGAKFGISPIRGRKPDLSVFLPGRRPPARGLVRNQPDIAVEVVSSSRRDQRRDREEKMAEYAEFGIPYYWIVDPQQRRFEVYVLNANGAYERAVAEATGLIANVPGCDGLSLDLDAMWAKADELA
ncbi:MAG TPA: Uma2 family endonuclease [Polyangiaceae bacterium]